MTASVFITATDTDAGKTWVTSKLIQALLQQGIDAKALKPIACGLNKQAGNHDILELLHAQGLQHARDINLYSFRQAAAPSIAAANEGKQVDAQELLQWCSQHVRSVKLCLIEAIGGLMVPLQKQYLVSDWLEGMPESHVILVVGSKLGCINHSLLSLEYLSKQQRTPDWIIINQLDESQDPQAIITALEPYIPKQCQILLCGHQQPQSLNPIIDWLKSL
ncbi:MAG: dethiobiotin synthase [Mariprofundaceae bacterium]